MEEGEITLSDKDLKLKTQITNEITTGGTRPIDVVETTLAKNGNERKAGSYIIKREYYKGDIDQQLNLYAVCKRAGLPVPPTFRKGVEKGENVLVITNMNPEGGQVWGLNDLKERSFPEHTTGNVDIERQLNQIATQAAENGIELTEYAYMSKVDDKGEVSFFLGDFGHTEVNVHPVQDDEKFDELKESNLNKVNRFLTIAGFVEDATPQAESIRIEL